MPSDFKKLLTARFLFTFAVQMQSVVLGWRIYELLHDPLYLGLIGLAEATPAIGFALYAGYLVDRMRPLLIYRMVIFTGLISGLFLLSESIFQKNFEIGTQVTLLYSASFLSGLAAAFSQPSIYASVPRILNRGQLLQGTATMTSTLQVARIAGPAAGGLLFGFAGSIATASTICAFLLAAMMAMLRFEKDIPANEKKNHHASAMEELLSGVKFVFRHRILFPAMTLDMVSVLFGGVTALLPIFASDILMVGAKGLGILRAGPAIGATLMTTYLARRSSLRTGHSLLWAVAGFGASILVFGFSRNFYLSWMALALSGAFDSISMVIRSTAVQLSSPDHMRGKISAVNSIFVSSSNELGEVESGIVARLMGTIPAVYFGGVVCLLTVGVVAYLSPTLRNLDLKKLAQEN